MKICFIIALLFWPALQANARPRVIYGNDDRRDLYQVDPATAKLADAMVALINVAGLTSNGSTSTLNSIPYNESEPLCTTERFYSQPTAAYCSGFLITPNLVVTAGHCITNQQSCANTKFVFGFALQSPTIPNPWEIPNSEIYSCAGIIHTISVSLGEDFALVRLDRAVPNHQPVTYRQTGGPQNGEAVMVMGFPEGLPLKIAAGANIRSVSDTYFTANTDTYEGNSGSAVFDVATGTVEGILVRGDTDYVTQNGCYVSHQCPNDGCRGEDSTLISRVLPYLKQ